MKKLSNRRKESFLSRLPEITIEALQEQFQNNLKFSFQFFDNSQAAGQDFKDWNKEQLSKLFEKLKQYCQKPINHWVQVPIGGGRHGRNHVLDIYRHFPNKSDFKHPRSIPFNVEWARFHLEGDMRLIGFIVNQDDCIVYCLHPNTFYVVFLDANHRFYLTD